MNDAATIPIPQPASVTASAADRVSITDIFFEFLIIGATSFGGGVVAYLRSGLVTRRNWVGDAEFVELLAISQTLPGLNTTNMAVLVGDKLRGAIGSIVAIIAVCLPGAAFMYITAILYHIHGDRPVVTAALKGVAAAAVGLILATAAQLGKRSLAHTYDLIFVALTVIGVNALHQSVPRVLIVVGILAILWYHPKRVAPKDVVQ